MESQLVRNTRSDHPIPRKIHQTWKDRDLPYFISRCFESISVLNAGWERKLYLDEDLEEVIGQLANASGNPEMLTLDEFRKIPSGIEKSDIFRCAVLYLEGGIYCDMDIEAIRPFEDMLVDAWNLGILEEHTDLLITTDHFLHCRYLYGRIIYMNHFMASKPRAKFLETFLCHVARTWRDNEWGEGSNPVWTTGPGVITHLLERSGNLSLLGIGILPSEWINPLPDMASHISDKEPFEEMIRNSSWRRELRPYAVHYWWHSYCGAPCLFDMYGDLLFQA